jgi:hypothetical protein
MVLVLDEILAETEVLAREVSDILPESTESTNVRVVASRVACSLSLEHWCAVQALLAGELLPSAVVVHRSQFEAVVRSVWLLYAATDAEVAKLVAQLSKESEQAAKNIASIQEMISDIEKHGPREAYNVLARFRDNALKPINSYVHSGVHAIRRHASGYPEDLMAGVLRNSNGIAVVAWMQAVVLEGRQDLQKAILQIADRYPSCVPARIL